MLNLTTKKAEPREVVYLRIPVVLADKLRVAAKQQDRTMNALITRALRQFLEGTGNGSYEGSYEGTRRYLTTRDPDNMKASHENL